MKFSIYLSLSSIFLSISLNGQVINSNEIEKGTSIQRNASFNVEEIKVRWKKAALENCPGIPCIVTPPPPSFTCGTSTITDLDNNIYTTVLIGTQCWTRENLRVRRYNDGTDIRFDTSGGTAGNVSGHTWSGIGLSYGAYSLYAHDSTASPFSNLSNYGYLYNWFAAAGITTDGGISTKNICPTGWHVPTDAEWTHLTNTLVGGLVGAGVVMKSTSSLWTLSSSSSDIGTNTSFFTALPGGTREHDGRFNRISSNAYFWSSSENVSGNSGRNRLLEYDETDVDRGAERKTWGQSIRCLKD